MERFILRFQGKAVNREGKDKVIDWRQSGTFSIKFLYYVLELGRSMPFLVGIVWNSLVLPKASFFTYETTWGKVLTLN